MLKTSDCLINGSTLHTHDDVIRASFDDVNDHKSYTQIPSRSWTFRTIGYGHSLETWKGIVSALRMTGYDHVISLEHEDGMMSFDEGVAKGLAALREVVTVEQPGEMFWA